MQNRNYHELTQDDAIVAFAADWQPGDQVRIRRHIGSTLRCTIDQIDVEGGFVYVIANEARISHDAGDRVMLWPRQIDRIVVDS